MTESEPRLLLLVAHPDDAEAYAGGLMTRYRDLGRAVKWVSLTNGDAGHHRLRGPDLARRRAEESAAAAALIGAEHAVWDVPDGHLEASLELRWKVVGEIRRWKPDLVLTHRPWDYHPDHRAAGRLVLDACYLVTVPALVSEAPALVRDPVVGFLCDPFTRPVAFRADVVLDICAEFDRVVSMLDCHASQMYEWLPVNRGVVESVPADPEQRKIWLGEVYRSEFAGAAARRYGEGSVELAEAFEIAEHGRRPEQEEVRRLFPVRTS
ncbi:MAG TPA: PIG-L family deacetylase [Verrucomicrobiales bacterium]|nr:PIG-L family deacetylase [Verrucomicrobiales bacterium]